MDVLISEGINKENAALLCEWSNDKGRDFQEQWMGTDIDYPLSYDKLSKLENLFSIFLSNEFVGIIQKVKIDEDNIHIGRFIINPEKTGMGLGKKSMEKFEKIILASDNIKSISLTVFDFNKNAKKLYEKLGFKIIETIEKPKKKYIMKKYR